MLSAVAARGGASAIAQPRQARRFRLVPFFTITSVAAFVMVGLALVLHEHRQSQFFREVQAEQSGFIDAAQAKFAREQEAIARRDLLAIHESGNVNLTRLFSNTLWSQDFAPFVERAQSIPVDACRALDDAPGANAKGGATPAKKACFAEVGARIAALPQFKAIDAKVFEAMRKSTVFKIKVFDLRGITMYSSEHAQIGEDKSANAGWRSAAAGIAASELTHRDKFSAFEGVVEDRDLISSYQPVRQAGSERIVGVFEVYSDVTPLLDRIKQATRQTAATAAANATRLAEAATINAAAADAQARKGLAIAAGLLLLLFAALYLIVRRADRIMTAQNSERESLQQGLGQAEKMAALGQMVAGVAHQLNTPLGFSRNNVTLVMERVDALETPVRVAMRLRELLRGTTGDSVVLDVARARAQLEALDASVEDLATMRAMLNDVLAGIAQMSELVMHMRDFTRLDRSTVAEFDVNQGLATVVYMARSVIPGRIRIVEEYGEVPPTVCNPSQLNQVFLNVITNASHAIAGEGTITVRTAFERGWVKVEIEDSGSGIPPDVLPHIFESLYTTKPRGEGTGLGLSIATDIVRSHGGEIRVRTQVGVGTTFEIYLPVHSQAELRQAA